MDTQTTQGTEASKLLLRVISFNDSTRKSTALRYVYDQQDRCVKIISYEYDTISGIPWVDSVASDFFYQGDEKYPYKHVFYTRSTFQQDVINYFQYDAIGRKIKDSIPYSGGALDLGNYAYSAGLILGHDKSVYPNGTHEYEDSVFINDKNVTKWVRYRRNIDPYISWSQTIYTYDDKNSPYKNLNVAKSTLIGAAFPGNNYTYINENNLLTENFINDGGQIRNWKYEYIYDADGYPVYQSRTYQSQANLYFGSKMRFEYSK